MLSMPTWETIQVSVYGIKIEKTSNKSGNSNMYVFVRLFHEYGLETHTRGRENSNRIGERATIKFKSLPSSH
jgi:hypothetical protein